MRELKIGGIYRHFKGNSYLVKEVVLDSETGEDYVVYYPLYGKEQKSYIRKKDMFLSAVDKEKYPDVEQKYRFELIELEDKTK